MNKVKEEGKSPTLSGSCYAEEGGNPEIPDNGSIVLFYFRIGRLCIKSLSANPFLIYAISSVVEESLLNCKPGVKTLTAP